MATKLHEGSKDKIEEYLKDLQIYCNEIERDVSYVTKNFMEYRNNNQTVYKLVRYEDIEKSPVDKMKELFLYLSVPMREFDVNLLNYYETDFQQEKTRDKSLWKYLTVPVIKRIQKGLW